MHAGDIGVRQVAAPVSACDIANRVGDGELDRLVGEANRVAVRVDHLEVAGSAAELRAGLEEGLIARLEGPERLVLDLGGAVAKRGVKRAAELASHDDVDRDRGENDGERDRRSGRDGEAGPEAHDSRKAYPTPRTVWISRGLPPASVLRRRYPM